MTSPEAHIKIEELRNELHRHNHNYYVLNAPEISDKEFDMLMKKLEELEKEFPEYSDPYPLPKESVPTLRKGLSMWSMPGR